MMRARFLHQFAGLYIASGLAIAAEAATEEPIPAIDCDQSHEQLCFRDFLQQEQRLLAKIDTAENTDRSGQTRELAQFYLDAGFAAEALSAIEILPEIKGETAGIAGEAAFRMGRFELASEYLQRAPEQAATLALTAMAIAKQGAYAAAMEVFAASGVEPPRWARAQYFEMMARAAINTEDYDAAEMALRRLRSLVDNGEGAGELRLLLADLAFQTGDIDTALSRYSSLRETGLDKAAVEATVGEIVASTSRGDLSMEQAMLRLRRVALYWQGGEVELRLLLATSEFAERARDYDASFEARNTIIAKFPNSDATQAALLANRRLLTTMLDDPSVSPYVAATIFYENIDYAPPGADGDTLIRRVASQLERLDLGEQAAELLEHQVFKRLRGAARAQEAVSLAELYLRLGQSAKALRTLRTTRISRLAPEVVEKRRHLEAQALKNVGDVAAVFSLLNEDNSTVAQKIRGEIYWDQARWVDAAISLEAYVVEQLSSRRLSKADSLLALRAVSAYLLAGLSDDARALSRAAGPKLDYQYTELATVLSDGDIGDNPDQVLEAMIAAFSAPPSIL